MKWGYKPTPKSHHRMAFAIHSDASNLEAEDLPPCVDLTEYTPEVMDQGELGSCVGHARASGITTALEVIGESLGWVVSPDSIYKLARCIERASAVLPHQKLPELDDTGAYPSCAQVAVSHWGVVPMGERSPDGRFSDCWSSTVNQEPDLLMIERASTTIVIGEYAIGGNAIQRGLGVRKALYLGAPVEIGSFVDTNYMNWDPDSGPYGKPNTSDPNGGGHDQLIIGYKLVGNQYWYRIRNSWGAAWGDNGSAWVTEEFLAQADDLNALMVQVSK